MDLPQKIEAILFWKAEPVTVKKLAELVDSDVKSTRAALESLESLLKGRGLSLVHTDDEVMLGTAKELSPLIEKLRKDELSRDLGKAGLETISIVLYQGPVSRADIDYIRGVNSQFIVRSLMIRGLVERVDNTADARSYLYKPTLELLSSLGLSKTADLPEYESVRKDIGSFRSVPGPAAGPDGTPPPASSAEFTAGPGDAIE